jgi:hypothetical protein
MLHDQLFWTGECNTDHCLVVAKGSKELCNGYTKTAQISHGFTLKNLSEVEGNKLYHDEISNRFAVLKNLDPEVDTNSAWETIRENIKTSTKDRVGYGLRRHTPWFDAECSKLSDKTKQAKWHRIQAKQMEIT